jgi:hypothetical protein
MIDSTIETWHRIPQSVIAYVKQYPIATMIEVGTWKGYSAEVWLSNLALQKLYCVDTWLGAVEFLTHPDSKRDLALRDGYPQVYYTFIHNMRARSLLDRIEVLPNTSHIAAQYFAYKQLQVDATYLDGSHDYTDVFADLSAYRPLTRTLLFGDDYSDEWPGVKQAVDQFVREQNVPLHCIERYWFIPL